MTKLEATGADLLSGDNQNVGGRWGGPAYLSGRNEMPNPDLRDFEANGNLVEWLLGAPARPDGWNVYARQTTKIKADGSHQPIRATEAQKQNLAKLPTSRYFFQQDTPILRGGPVPPPDRRAAIAGPQEAPRVKVVEKQGAVGFKAGPYWRSYAWILGPDPENSRFITPAAPAVSVTALQGQTMEDTIPAGVPPGVTGVALLSSNPGGARDRLFVLRKVDIRGNRKTYLHTAFRRSAKVFSVQSEDRSGSGAFQERETDSRRVNASKDTAAMDVRLSYRLNTKTGPTASQGWKRVQVGEKREREAVAFEPRNPPQTATGWMPEFEGKDGEVYRIPYKNGSEWWPMRARCEIFTDDAADWPDGKPRPVRVKRVEEDESGVPAPKSPMDEPLVAGDIEMPPGRYRFLATNEVSGRGLEPDRESPPSPPRTVILRDAGLATGGIATGVSDRVIRVYRPHPQSIANARLTDYGNDGLDLDWDSPNVAAVTVDTDSESGVLKVTDTSESVSTEDVKRTDYFPIDATRRQTIRLLYDVASISGRASAYVRFYGGVNDADENLQPGAVTGVDVLLGEGVATGVTPVKRVIGPDTSGGAVAAPALARFGRIVFKNRAGAVGELRNMVYRVKHIGRWMGAAPRKRYPKDIGLAASGTESRPAKASEEPGDPYPPGAYCHVVEAPEDKAPGIPGNYVEYWAPSGTPRSPDHFMRALKVPVKPNQARVRSAYLGCEEVGLQASLLSAVVKDRRGRVLMELGSLAQLLGDSPWTRYHDIYTTPPNAAYVEYVGGAAGDGLIRAMGFQDEIDPGTAVPTAFTNAHPTTGFLSVILDTDTPGKVIREAPRKTATWHAARAVVTHEEDASGNEITAASLEFRAAGDPDGNLAQAKATLGAAPWRASLSAVLANEGMRRLLEVRVNLSTTNATLSPRVRGIFLRLSRIDPVLLRPDGSEFLGGARVDNLSVPQREDNVIVTKMADGSFRRSQAGKERPRTIGGLIECFSDEAAEEIREMQGEEGEFLVSDWYREYLVRFSGVSLAPDLSGYLPTDAAGRDGYFRHTAEFEGAEVLSEVPL